MERRERLRLGRATEDWASGLQPLYILEESRSKYIFWTSRMQLIRASTSPCYSLQTPKLQPINVAFAPSCCMQSPVQVKSTWGSPIAMNSTTAKAAPVEGSERSKEREGVGCKGYTVN